MMAKYGNFQKYQNPNPIQQWLLGRFLQQVAALTESLGASSVLDAGCAEGFVSRYLRQYFGEQSRFWGVDVDVEALARGRGITPWLYRGRASVMALPFGRAQFDLVLCNEVLEHLDDPGAALRELCRVSRRYVLLSVPHEPWFRGLNFLRGKHLRRWGNDPEHVNNWSGQQFTAFVAEEMEVLVTRQAFPWWVVLGRV